MTIFREQSTGLSFNLRSDSSDRSVVHEVLESNCYKLDPVEFSSFKTIVDIGANVGAFSLYAAVLAPKARVIAYEPEPDNFLALKRNVELNGLSGRIEIHNCAVSDRRGTDTITRQCGNSRLGQTAIADNPSTLSDVEKALCTVVTLEDVVADCKIDDCDFLKLDCEGSEFYVLNAPVGVVRRFKRMAMETHWFNETRWSQFLNRLRLTHEVVVQAGYLFARAK